MVKRYTMGSGITKRERVLIESADAMHEWVEQTKGAWDCVGIIERQAVQILKDAGLPTQPAAYFDRPSPAMQSPEWYALEALIWAGRLRKSAEDGKGLEAGRCGVYMGQLWAEAALKFRWEEHALRGKKVIEGSRKAHVHAHGNGDDKQQEWAKYQADLNAVLNKNPHQSLTNARRLVAKNHSVCYDTVRRHTVDRRKKTTS